MPTCPCFITTGVVFALGEVSLAKNVFDFLSLLAVFSELKFLTDSTDFWRLVAELKRMASSLV